MNVITMSAVIVTLFLGGPQGLFDIPVIPGAIEGSLWLLVKVLAFLYLYVWFRATLPRLRYDQLMDFGWKLLIPVSLGWFLLIAALRQFAPDGASGDSIRVVVISVLVGAVATGLFLLALRVARRNRLAAAGVPAPAGPTPTGTQSNSAAKG